MDKIGYLCPEAASKHSMQINTKQISRCPAGSCAVIGQGEHPDLDFFSEAGRKSDSCLPCLCSFKPALAAPASSLGVSRWFPLPCVCGVVLSSQVGEQFIQCLVSPQALWAAAQLYLPVCAGATGTTPALGVQSLPLGLCSECWAWIKTAQVMPWCTSATA